jgi:hypothetical protein
MKTWSSLLAAGLLLSVSLPGGATPQDSGIPPMLEGPRPLTSSDAKAEPRPPAEVKPPAAATPQPAKAKAKAKTKTSAAKTKAAKKQKQPAKKKTKTSKAALTSAGNLR